MEARRPVDELPQVLRFQPDWIWDPVPDWIIRQFDEEMLRELLVIQLEHQRELLEVQRTLLDLRAKKLERMTGLLG